MWWVAILTIKTFFKAKKLVVEYIGGKDSWWREDEQIWKTLIYFNIENTYCSTFKMNDSYSPSINLTPFSLCTLTALNWLSGNVGFIASVYAVRNSLIYPSLVFLSQTWSILGWLRLEGSAFFGTVFSLLGFALSTSTALLCAWPPRWRMTLEKSKLSYIELCNKKNIVK